MFALNPRQRAPSSDELDGGGDARRRTRPLDVDLDASRARAGLGLNIVWEYSTDLFDPETIDRMADQFLHPAAEIIAAPQRRVSELSLLAEDERRQVLVEFNRTQVYVSQRRGCLHELFERQVARTPQRAGGRLRRGPAGLRELNQRANRLAHRCGLGVDPDRLVALCRALARSGGRAPRVLKAGGAYLPLDPELPDDRLGFMLADSDAPVLLTSGAHRQAVVAWNRDGHCRRRRRYRDRPHEPDRPETSGPTTSPT